LERSFQRRNDGMPCYTNVLTSLLTLDQHFLLMSYQKELGRLLKNGIIKLDEYRSMIEKCNKAIFDKAMFDDIQKSIGKYLKVVSKYVR
jgi:hypothetical protein